MKAKRASGEPSSTVAAWARKRLVGEHVRELRAYLDRIKRHGASDDDERRLCNAVAATRDARVVLDWTAKQAHAFAIVRAFVARGTLAKETAMLVSLLAGVDDAFADLTLTERDARMLADVAKRGSEFAASQAVAYLWLRAGVDGEPQSDAALRSKAKLASLARDVRKAFARRSR